MRFKNEAPWDRILRALIGVVGIWLGFAQMGGAGGVIVGLVGVVLLVTGAVGWCPIYAALKTGTARLTGADASSGS